MKNNPAPEPFFSVVVPLFNAESTVRRAVESLQAQSFENWEAVFVDDGSPDGSAAAVEESARNDPRLRLVRHPDNRGTHAARKTGVAAAAGTWILFLDPDDAFATGAFVALSERLRTTSAEFVRFGFSPMDPSLCSEDQLAFFRASASVDRRLDGPCAALDAFFTGRNVPLFICTIAVRSGPAKTAFAATESLRLTCAEDVYEVFAMASAADGYEECAVDAYRYRLGAGGMTSWRHALFRDPGTWLDGFGRTAPLRAAASAALFRFADFRPAPPALRRRIARAARAERRRILVGVFPWELSVAKALGCPRDRLRGFRRSLLAPLRFRDRILLRAAWSLRRTLEPLGLLARPPVGRALPSGQKPSFRRCWRRFLERRRTARCARRRGRMLRASASVEAAIAAGSFSEGPLPRLHVYSLCRNENAMIPWFVGWYARFAEKIVVFDNESTDDSAALLRASSPKVEVRPFSTGGLLDDFATMRLRNSVWKESRGKADLVLVVDMDEFLWHPRMEDFLRAFAAGGWTVLAPRGAQMVSETFPAWTPGRLLPEVIRTGDLPPVGSRSFRQRSKWCLLDPNAVEDMGWGPGNHTARPRGRIRVLASDEAKLLHYDYIGRDRIFGKMRANRGRMSEAARKAGLAKHYFAPESDRLAWFEGLLKRAKDVT